MKGTKKLILTLAMSAAMAFGVVGFAACSAGADGKSAYEIAVEHGFEGTEEEWLESLKGANGKDGKDGVNGTNGTNGKDGKDGTNGKDGKDGANGTDGKNGTDGTNGKDGKSAYEIWLEQGHTGSEADFLEWLRGGCNCEHDNDKQPEPVEPLLAELGEYTIAAGENQWIYDYVAPQLADLPTDFYVYVEADVAPASGILTMELITGTTYKYDMYMPLSNQFKAYFNKTFPRSPSFYIRNTSENTITIKVKALEYSTPTIEAGVEYEIPSFAPSLAGLPVNLAPELIDKELKFTISNYDTNATKYPRIFDGISHKTSLLTFTADHKISDGVYQMTGTLPAGTASICIGDMVSYQGKNLIVKIELA